MIPPQISSTVPLAPLLALPLELKQLIFDYLSVDEDLELSLTILRRTHPILRNVIPRQDLSPGRRLKTIHGEGFHCRLIRLKYGRQKQLLMCELKYPYLFAAGLYPCYCCSQVLEENHFEGYKSKYRLGLNLVPNQQLRRCDDCLAVSVEEWDCFEKAANRPPWCLLAEDWASIS